MINEKQKKDEEMIWVRMKSQCSKISKHDEILSLIIIRSQTSYMSG